jgi:tRNA-2-methylthio-N6-dimethylallyladenosine synthase
LIEAMGRLPHVCRHIHLPVQSGSTRVLAEMRRRHTREDYLQLVDALRAGIPGIQLSTDMIVGFPGETDEDFNETMTLVERVGYHSMFSFKYSERPNTLASKRLPDDVPEDVKSRRLAALQELQKGIQANLHAGLVGADVEILVDSVSRRRDTELSGRTSGNTVVNVPGPAEWLGRRVVVRVERSGPNSVWGRAVSSEPA